MPSRTLPRMKRLLYILMIMVSCLGCDQASKVFARDTLPQGERVSMLGDVFRLQYAENTGAFLGLGDTLPEGLRAAIFTGIVTLILLGLLAYLIATPTLPMSILAGLSLVVGGGLSNLLDRVINEGRVIDFLNLGIGSLRTGIFNVADMAIMLGLLLVVVLRKREES